MADKIDSTGWTGDYPLREEAPFNVKNGRKVLRFVLITVAMTSIVTATLILVVGA